MRKAFLYRFAFLQNIPLGIRKMPESHPSEVRTSQENTESDISIPLLSSPKALPEDEWQASGLPASFLTHTNRPPISPDSGSTDIPFGEEFCTAHPEIRVFETFNDFHSFAGAGLMVCRDPSSNLPLRFIVLEAYYPPSSIKKPEDTVSEYELATGSTIWDSAIDSPISNDDNPPPLLGSHGSLSPTPQFIQPVAHDNPIPPVPEQLPAHPVLELIPEPPHPQPAPVLLPAASLLFPITYTPTEMPPPSPPVMVRMRVPSCIDKKITISPQSSKISQDANPVGVELLQAVNDILESNAVRFNSRVLDGEFVEVVERIACKNAVDFTKGCVYVDDQLETDFEEHTEVIKLMKLAVLKVFDELNVKTDLQEGPPKKKTKYLGWLMCATELGIRLPGDKRSKMTRAIANALSGAYNIKTNEPKKTPFLFSDREWSSLMGLLQYFVDSRPTLKPFLTPLFRASDRFGPATSNHDGYAGKRPPVFRKIPILKGTNLQKCLVSFMEIIAMNCLIPFQNAFRRPCLPCTHTFNLYCDAAGEKSPFNRHAFGMGGICYDFGFAWQCPRKVFVPFLNSAKDTQKDKIHINAEELLAQQVGKYMFLSQILGADFNGDLSGTPPAPTPAGNPIFSRSLNTPQNIGVWCWGDNDTAQCWLRKNRAKHFFLSRLVALTDALAVKANATFVHTSCSSEQMEYAGADELSRFRRRSIFGIPVLLVTRSLFEDFKLFFSSGTRDFYISLLNPLLGHKVSKDFIFYMASFAAFAKQDKTNNQRIRNSWDAKSKALSLKITHLLPATTMTAADCGYAALATGFAIDNWYAAKTLVGKTFGWNVFITIDHKNKFVYPFTKLVLKGIRRMRQTESQLGVVLGKDVLDIFNSSLNPNKYFWDLNLVTFD